MSFTQFLSILKARKKVALMVLLLTIGVTLLVSFVLPKRYSATASVVIDVKPDPISAVMYPGMLSPTFMATQVDVIRSDRVALRVAKNLKLTESPVVREQWMSDTKGSGAIEDWLAASLQKQLDVQPSRESNVIAVSYSAPDASFAAALANAFVQAYLDVSLELRVDPAKQYTAFFDTRGKEARDALEAAQAKLSTFQNDKGIIAADERLDIETSRLNELSSQLVMLQAVSSESTSRQQQAQGGSSDRMQEVLNNSVISGLKVDLTRAEARLQELSARLGDSNPQVIEAKASIAELRSRMDVEVKRVTGGVTVSNSINKQREAQLRADLETQRGKVLRLKAVRDEAAVLSRDVENAQRSYDAVLARLNQATLESQSTQNQVNILTRAVPPAEPSSPKILLNSLLSIFVGAVLAVAVALGLEMADRRIRANADILDVLGLPVLGTLPHPNAKTNRVMAGNSLMQQRLLGSSAIAKGNQ